MDSQTIVGKAMGNPVRLQILEELAQGPLTLEDLAENIHLKTESIYHHIRILQQVGLVEEFEPMRSGGPGRPYARFRLTGKNVTIQYPQRNYYRLSEILINNLSKMIPEAELKGRMRDIGEQIGQGIAQTIKSENEIENWSIDDVKKHFVDDYLRKSGMQPEVVEVDDKSMTYRHYNCLFLDLAKKYPELICAMDEGVIEGAHSNFLPKSEAKRTKCIGEGDDFCEYQVCLSSEE